MSAVAGPVSSATAASAAYGDQSTRGDQGTSEDQCVGEDLRRALRQHPAGVAVVTAAQGRCPVGMTVTTFTSVSLSPALISLLVARSASTWPVFERAAYIGVHLLPAHAHQLATTFARPGADRFAPPTRWVPDVHGVPALQDAGVRLSCAIHQLIPLGDHVLVVARVESVQHPEEACDPLIWHDGGYQRVSTWPEFPMIRALDGDDDCGAAVLGSAAPMT